jgi:hypothetical protein
MLSKILQTSTIFRALESSAGQNIVKINACFGVSKIRLQTTALGQVPTFANDRYLEPEIGMLVIAKTGRSQPAGA